MSDSPVEMQVKRSLFEVIFVSPDERRLRAGWRLLGHSLLFFVGLMLLGVLTTLISIVFFSGDISALLDISNPIALLVNAVLLGLIVTAATWLARRWLDRRSMASLGLHRDRYWLRDLVFGIGLGGLLMAFVYALHVVLGWTTFTGWGWETSNWWIGLGATLLAYLVVGFQEELLVRGYYLQNLKDGIGLPLAVIISSLVFSVLHLQNLGADMASVLGIFLAGLFLAYGWIRTHQLWIPIGLHIGWNFFQGSIFGFPVSGSPGFHLIQHAVDGPTLFTGGEFGPEAGLSGWAAILLGTALIYLYTRNRSLSPATSDPSNTQD